MKYYEISSPSEYEGYIIDIIAANSYYEALGYFFETNGHKELSIEDTLYRQEYPEDHPIEMSCIGFPVYKTLKALYEEKDSPQLPVKIVSVID